MHQPVLQYQFRFLDSTKKENALSLTTQNIEIDFATKKINLNFRIDMSGKCLDLAQRQFKPNEKFIIETLSSVGEPVEAMLFTISKMLKHKVNLDYRAADLAMQEIELEFKSAQIMYYSSI